MKKGDGTIEFYANLKWLREQYESGLVVAKRLYEKAVKEKGFKIGYWQFTKYFNEELNQRKPKQVEQKAKEVVKEVEPEPQGRSTKKTRTNNYTNRKEKKSL